jgi:hypothetical protein
VTVHRKVKYYFIACTVSIFWHKLKEMSLPAWGDSVNENSRLATASRVQQRAQRPVETYHSEIYAEVSSKPLHYGNGSDGYKDPLKYDKEGVDKEIKAAQAATAAFVHQQEQQQHEFDELNCRQWMHNIAERLSTLSTSTSKIQHQMIKSGDLDRDVGCL